MKPLHNLVPQRPARESLFNGSAGRIFTVLTAGYIIVKLGRFIIPPLLPMVITDLSISTFQAGIGLTLMTACFSFIQYPSGRLADGLSRKSVHLSSLLLITAGFLALTVTPTYAGFLLAMAIIGVGDGMYGPATMALLSDLYHEQRGRVFGLHMASVDVGGLLAAGSAILIIGLTSWRTPFQLLAISLLGTIGALHVVSNETIVLTRTDLKLRETIDRLRAIPSISTLLVPASLILFTVQGVFGFLPLYLQTAKGFSPVLANTTFAALFLVGIVSKPVSGSLSDNRNRLGVGTCVLAFGALGIGLFVFSSTAAIVVLGVGIFAAGQKAFTPILQAWFMDVFPDNSKAGDLGAVRSVYMAIGSLGPAYVGFIAGRFNYTVAFTGFLFCLIGSTAIVLWLYLEK